MQVIHNLEEWQNIRPGLAKEESIGFIPTMGNLHAGHASLYKRSKQENHCTVASIFINSTQFNRVDDFNRYPRTLEADLNLLQKIGVDYCLLPTEEAMYQDGYCYQLQETKLCQLMEGRQRPGHFTGVLTIVMKFLNLVKPHKAYFGEKDFQQYLLIRDMVKAFFMDIDIKACPTVREASGLAYSSRNNRLSPSQRLIAEDFARIFHQKKALDRISQELKEKQGLKLDYLEEHEGRRFVAVLIDEIRLIDNYPMYDE